MNKINISLYTKPGLLNKLYKKYILLAGFLFLLFPLCVSIIKPKNFYIEIFNYLYLISGVFFILCGIGEFANKYDRFIQITNDYFKYKLENNKSRTFPWDHIINVDIKKQSVEFTFKNSGKKEINISCFQTHDIQFIKETLYKIKEFKKI